MNILGMFGPGPNPSAALIKDGKLVGFLEEERLNRVKTAPNSIPIESARYLLTKAGLSLDDIDGIAYGWDCPRYSVEAPGFFEKIRKEYNDTTPMGPLQEEMFLNLYHPERIQQALQLGLGSLSKTKKVPPVKYYPHHLAHAASAFYCSGFEEANIITLDGSGEEITALLARGGPDGIEVLKRIEVPHSLGGFYATFTEYLGFKAYQDEGKLMGLAAYGKYNEIWEKKIDKVITFDQETGDFEVDPKWRYIGEHTHGARFTDEFVELFGQKRDRSVSALTAPFPDIAYAVQNRLELVILALSKWLTKQTGLKKYCLAGGVAMNCKMNGKLASQDFVDDVFVQPAASDNGVSLGAALLYAKEKGKKVAFRLNHLYYGTEYTDAEIKKALDEAKLKYEKVSDVEAQTAKLLQEGKIIGWFQGAMEVGARALGNRSILANPMFPEMKEKLNLEVKHRENWRPFCPSMKVENYKKYINAKCDSPFMIMAFEVYKEYHKLIPGCVHVDGTARPQAVRKEDNLRFWTLINEFEKLTGHGILINTSFNIQGEPIVCSPRDALRCFGGTGLDVLVMGNYMVKKPYLS